MNAFMHWFIALLVVLCFIEDAGSQEVLREAERKPEEGSELIGTRAPELSGLDWLNTEPLQIEDLKGNVVLIRFWLIGCPFCENTAPSLVELDEKYRASGLKIIGIHHPKSERSRDANLVMRVAEQFGYDFAIAQDNEWKVIDDYWLGEKRRRFTSSTFLIDKRGVIRYVHPGGEFYKSDDSPDADRAFRAIEKKIKELLAE